MDELLQKLLEAEVLSEDTKKELESAFSEKLEEAINVAKEEAATSVRADLTAQWVEERETLVEAIDTKVTDFLDTEISELKEDIEKFRDLEAEYADRLVEAEAALKDEAKADLVEIVDKIDSFLEIRLNAEMDELREDIEEVRKNEFGRRIFEGYLEEFTANYADEESVAGNLRESEARLKDTQAALEEAERKVHMMERDQKMEEVLSPLTGRQREVMEAILRNVATEQLEEGYKTFLGRVVRETTDEETTAEGKDSGVLAEGETEGDQPKEKKLEEGDGVVVTGDNEALMEEQSAVADAQHKMSPESMAALRKLAGN